MSLVRTCIVALSLVVLSQATSSAPARAQMAASIGDESGGQFQECVSAYMRMRRQIIEQLVGDGAEPDPRADTRFRRRPAAAIQEARHDSRPGDILCAGIAERILRRSRSTWHGEGRWTGEPS